MGRSFLPTLTFDESSSRNFGYFLGTNPCNCKTRSAVTDAHLPRSLACGWHILGMRDAHDAKWHLLELYTAPSLDQNLQITEHRHTIATFYKAVLVTTTGRHGLRCCQPCTLYLTAAAIKYIACRCFLHAVVPVLRCSICMQ